MKVCLVRGRWHSIWESLACGYLYSMTKDLVGPDDYTFADGYFESDSDAIRLMAEADLVGISATTSQMPWSLRMVRAARERNPDLIAIAGGYGPSIEPGKFTDNASPLDGVVAGDGELAWRRIVGGLATGGNWPYGSRVAYEPVLQLDDLPFPDRNFIKVERCIQVAVKEEGRRVTGIFGNRGCLRRCKFCADGTKDTIFGIKLRERSPANIADEMERVAAAHNIEFFKFADPEVNTRPGRTRELCAELIRRDWVAPWGGNFLVNPFDVGDAQALYQAGCREAWFGLESGSPEILRHIGKGTSVPLTRKAFAAAKSAGIMRRAYVLLGTPPETLETIKQTEALIDEVQPDTVSFSILAPYPGTEYYDEGKHGGLDWEKIDEYGGSNPWRSDALSHETLLAERLRLIEKYKGHLSRIMHKKIALGVIDTGEIQLTDFIPDRC